MAKPVPKSASKPVASSPSKPSSTKRKVDTSTGIPTALSTDPALPTKIDPRVRRLSTIAQAVGLLDTLKVISAAVVEEVVILGLDDNAVFSQELLGAALALDRMEKGAKKLSEALEAYAIAHFKSKKAFEPGRYAAVVELDKVGKKSPKWKDLAIAERKAHCEKLGIPFDAEAYEKMISDQTAPSKKDQVSIVETA